MRTPKANVTRNILNFLGYAAERTVDFVDRRMTVALAYPFGVQSMLRNKLIEPATYTLNAPGNGLTLCPGVPYGSSFEGYRLTARGRRLAEIGKRARKLGGRGDHWQPFIKEAQLILDEAIRESNMRAA